MNKLNKLLVTTALTISSIATFSAASAEGYNDDDYRFNNGAYVDHDREYLKRQNELEREYRKHQREISREMRKHRAEMNRERRKHEREMEREFRKGYRQRDRYGYEEIIWGRGYGDRIPHRRRGLDDLSVIIDILYRL